MLLVGLFTVFPSFIHGSHAAEVTLAWDANSEPNIAGYKIYYGLQSGTYSDTVNVGNFTSCVISDLVEGQTYYFAATAYNTVGYESDYSKEVSVYIKNSQACNPDPKGPFIQPVTVDNGGSDTSYTGTWGISSASGSYETDSYWARDGATYTWHFNPSVSGYYEVSMWWTEWSSRSASIPVAIQHAGETATVYINQQIDGGRWNTLGEYFFEAGATYNVTVTSQPYPSSTCADAVSFTFTGSDP